VTTSAILRLYAVQLVGENSTWSQGSSFPLNIWRADLSAVLPGLGAMPALQVSGLKMMAGAVPGEGDGIFT
jgi:hypothetical protein